MAEHPVKGRQGAAILARERRAADLDHGKLITALCPGLLDTKGIPAMVSST